MTVRSRLHPKLSLQLFPPSSTETVSASGLINKHHLQMCWTRAVPNFIKTRKDKMDVVISTLTNQNWFLKLCLDCRKRAEILSHDVQVPMCLKVIKRTKTGLSSEAVFIEYLSTVNLCIAGKFACMRFYCIYAVNFCTGSLIIECFNNRTIPFAFTRLSKVFTFHIWLQVLITFTFIFNVHYVNRKPLIDTQGCAKLCKATRLRLQKYLLNICFIHDT